MDAEGIVKGRAVRRLMLARPGGWTYYSSDISRSWFESALVVAAPGGGLAASAPV